MLSSVDTVFESVDWISVVCVCIGVCVCVLVYVCVCVSVYVFVCVCVWCVQFGHLATFLVL